MGLAMSRSLGDDIAHQAGVSSEPEVMEHDIDASDQVKKTEIWQGLRLGSVKDPQVYMVIFTSVYGNNDACHVNAITVHLSC